MNTPFLPSWVTSEPVYVTLIEHDPDAVKTTILIERSLERIPRTKLYQPVAFVVTFSDGIISINGKIEDLAEEAMQLCSLCDEAMWATNGTIGNRYYSDPDAS